MNDISLKNRILFVDDEPRITSALRATFRRDFNIVVANSGEEALLILEKHQIDVLVSDERMPGMLGHQLLSKVSQLYPKTIRILLTGFTDKKAIVDSINDGEVYRFINKPWQNDAMREVLHEAALASKTNISSIKTQSDRPALAESMTSIANPTPEAKPVPLPVADRALLMIGQHKGTRHQIRRFCNKNKIMIYGTQNIEQAVAAVATRKKIGVAVMELANENDAAIQIINVLKRVRPDLITIALTDEYDAETAVSLINQGQVFKYLAKPIGAVDFENAIQNAFVRHEFLKSNKAAHQRFSVGKPKGVLSESLKKLISRLRS